MAFKHYISFATDLTANFGWNQFRIMPDIVSKLLRATVRSCCAVLSRRPFLWQVAFDLLPIWLRIFGCNRFRIMPDIVSKLLCAAIWSRCAVWLESEQTPFLWQVVDLDLLLCTGFNSEHAILFLCYIFTQRPMNDHKIERSNGRCFGLQQLLVDSMRTSFPNEKKICRHGQISTKH